MQRIFIPILFLLLMVKWSPAHSQQVGTLATEPGARFEAISYAPSGYLYTLDYWTGKIYKISPSHVVQEIASGFNHPVGGTVDQQGNFYFSEFGEGKIYKVRPDDSYNEFASGFQSPTGIAVNPTGDTLYVVNYGSNSIRKVCLADSSVSYFAGSSSLNGPDGIVLAPNGDLIVASFNTSNLHRIDAQTGAVSLFASILGSSNTGYIARVGNDYYSAGFNSNRIWKIDSVGTVSLFAGTATAGSQNGNAATATFSKPNGIIPSPTGDTLFITQESTTGLLRYITPLNVPTSLPMPAGEPFSLSLSPNPSQGQVAIQFETTAAGHVEIDICDINGRKLIELAKGDFPSGVHELHWNTGSDSLANGIYLCRMQVDGQSISRRLVLAD